MDPMDWLEQEQLLLFFRRHKTVMSCMEKPHTFLSQLRDHDLVPEDRYEKLCRMKSKDNIKKGLYGILDWLEKEQSQRIKDFWSCIFKDTILNQYSYLRELRNILMNETIEQSPEGEETDKEKRKGLSDDEEGAKKQTNSVKKKRKLRSDSARNDEEEQAGPSSSTTPRRKSKKICFSSTLKKGEKSDIWTWTMFKHQLPVTCGQQQGTLNRDRLAKGEKCIAVGKQWFTPNEFETFAGKKSSKNWKMSIRCKDTPLGKLIEEGHLKAATFRRRSKKVNKSLFPTGDVLTVSEEEGDENSDEDQEDQVSSCSKEDVPNFTVEEVEEQTEQQPESSRDSGRKVFKVTCGALAGLLHKRRFASGTLGKSIRTETSWMTPVEFISEASCPADASWKKDIKYEGEPLGVLIKAKILSIHSLLCTCRWCKPDGNDQVSQKNDDECCICKEEGEELVVCDHCPRSFHQQCHLPHVEDTLLGDERPWMCTFCVFKTSRDWHYWDEVEREVVMSRQISHRMLQCQYLLLYLCSADEEQMFTTDPCLYLQRYTTVINTPMWLGKIADKLQRKLYLTIGDFVSDVQLVFSNCATFNKDNDEILAVGNSMTELFDREFKSVFNISD